MLHKTNTKLKHKHKFKPAIAFDWQGNDYMYGLCECGEKDM